MDQFAAAATASPPDAASRFVEARRLELSVLVHLQQLRGMVRQAERVYDAVNEAMGDREAELVAGMEMDEVIRLDGLVLTCVDMGFKALLVENEAEGLPA